MYKGAWKTDDEDKGNLCKKSDGVLYFNIQNSGAYFT